MSYNALNDRLEEFSGKLYCFLTINEVIEQGKPYSTHIQEKPFRKPRITFSTFHATLTLEETLKIIVFTLAGFEVACYLYYT